MRFPSGRSGEDSWCRESLRKLSLDMAFRLRHFRCHRQFDLTHVELLVEVRELSSGVLQKKLPLKQQSSAKQVQKQHSSRNKNDGAVFMKENGLVLGHELQLVHKPEAVGEKESDGDE